MITPINESTRIFGKRSDAGGFFYAIVSLVLAPTDGTRRNIER